MGEFEMPNKNVANTKKNLKEKTYWDGEVE